MPSVRSPGQVMLTFWSDVELVRDMDRVRGRKDRSQFIREAIVEKLDSLGVRVPKDLIYAPGRAKIVQIVGDNNRHITLRAAEESGTYRAKKRRKKK